MKNNDKKSNRISAVKLAEVALPNVTVKQLQNQTEDYVKYGATNDFPTYLINSVNKSSAHSSILEKKAELIVSEGLSYDETIADFLDNINEYDTVNDLLERVSEDLATLETCAVIVHYNILKNKILSLDYLDSSMVRPALNRDNEGNLLLDRIKGYYVCSDWKNVKNNAVYYYDAFNPKNVKSGSQLYFYFKPKLGEMYLPNVSYLSVMHFIELHYELSKFSLNTVLNGFFSSAIMKVKENRMTEDEIAVFESQLKKAFTGSENASKLMVSFVENMDEIDITPLSTNDNTALLVALKNMCIAEICSAHKIQPILAGIQSDGSNLGSDGKLYRDSLEIYYNTTIRQLQKPFMNFLDKVLKFNGYKEYELEITSSALLSNTLDIATKMDMLKPEVWLAEYGYTREDIKQELLDELEQEASDIENENDIDVSTITGEDKPIL